MTRYFKITVLTSLIFILVHQYSLGQDTSKTINGTWQTLKTQLLRRTGLATRFEKVLEQTQNVDTILIRQLKTNTTLLNNLLNYNQRLASSIVTNIHDKNDSLSRLIRKGFDTLQSDKNFTRTEEFQDITIQLEGTGNRIYIAVRDFNEACKSIGRQDLYFKKLWGDEP